jgi:formate dehydrogenase subunit gamma
MTHFLTRVRGAVAAALFGLALAAATAPATVEPAAAQAPAAPSAANEQMLFNYLQGSVQGRVTIPDQRAALLIQPQGRDFQHYHRTTLKWLGGIAIGGMLVVLILFYMIRGKVRIEAGPSGRTIERFNGVERFAHWLTASCFIVLGITGLNISFGRDLLLPLMGAEAFAAWSQWAKVAHNFLSFPFTLGVLLMLVLWIKDNIPNGDDVKWFAAGGGLVGHSHPPSRRFNGGQKVVFWATVLGGGAIAATGFIMMFPFQVVTTMEGMQLATQLHGIISLLMIALILAHIYIGSIGMEGAFAAMGSGKVDLNWAKEHHGLWVDEVMSGGRGASVPAGASKAGAD